MRFIADEEWLLPKRATSGSAGYDFVMPKDVTIPPKTMVDFDTGVKAVEMPSDTVLLLLIRSSVGRSGIIILNSVAVIDSDYNMNMRAFLYNTTDQPATLRKGDRYMQGIFTDYYTVEGDMTTATRNGGVGSTGK